MLWVADNGEAGLAGNAQGGCCVGKDERLPRERTFSTHWAGL